MKTEGISNNLKALELLQRERESIKSNTVHLTALAFKRAGLDEDETDDFLRGGADKEIFNFKRDAITLYDPQNKNWNVLPRGSVIMDSEDYECQDNYLNYVIQFAPKKFDVYFNELLRGSKVYFEEKQSKLIVRGIEMPIAYDSKQYYVCKLMFNRSIGEIVSWDELAEAIDDTPVQLHPKVSWRTVYDAVRAVNKKVKEIAGIELFKISRKSYSRIL